MPPYCSFVSFQCRGNWWVGRGGGQGGVEEWGSEGGAPKTWQEARGGGKAGLQATAAPRLQTSCVTRGQTAAHKTATMAV